LPAAARLIIRQMAPLSSSNIANAFGIPSGLALAVEYRAIAALQFFKVSNFSRSPFIWCIIEGDFV